MDHIFKHSDIEDVSMFAYSLLIMNQILDFQNNLFLKKYTILYSYQLLNRW